MHNAAQKVAKSSCYMFSCDKCDYSTSKKSNYNKHLTTDKHKMLYDAALNVAKSSFIGFACVCGKTYKQHQSLYRHKKACLVKTELSEDQLTAFVENHIDYKQIIDKLIEENVKLAEQNNKLAEQNNKLAEQNNKLTDTVTELVPKIGNNNTITTKEAIHQSQAILKQNTNY